MGRLKYKQDVLDRSLSNSQKEDVCSSLFILVSSCGGLWPSVQLEYPFSVASTMELSSTFSRESALWRDSSAGSIMGRVFCSGKSQGF